jgi:hypothetical protein
LFPLPSPGLLMRIIADCKRRSTTTRESHSNAVTKAPGMVVPLQFDSWNWSASVGMFFLVVPRVLHGFASRKPPTKADDQTCNRYQNEGQGPHNNLPRLHRVPMPIEIDQTDHQKHEQQQRTRSCYPDHAKASQTLLASRSNRPQGRPPTQRRQRHGRLPSMRTGEGHD